MYIAHHNGALNRYKVRKRKYLHSGNNFIEVKFKNNKGRTIKTRIQRTNFESNLSPEELKFITKTSNLNGDKLEVKTITEYSRFTLLNRANKERITIDNNLSFCNENSTLSFPYIAIIEIKQERQSKNSFLAKLLREKKIHPTGLSKYCIGSILTNKSIKYNIFKTKLAYLKKLNHHEYIYNSFV